MPGRPPVVASPHDVTWIIAITGLRTCAALVGDVRVTAGDRSFDGVRKVHLVTPSAAVGFSGPVRLGLRAVADLQQHAVRFRLRGVNDLRAGIDSWGRRVRRAWATELDERTRTAYPLHFLVVTTWRRPNAEPEADGVALVDAAAFVLKSPEFKVGRVATGQVVAIGSGQAYVQLTERLASIEGELDGLTHFERPEWEPAGGIAAPLVGVLSRDIRDLDPQDVSQHLHVAVVRPDASAILTYDLGGGADPGETIPMPEVATTDEEFAELARRHAVAEAIAIA